jgi:hypothetical protein
MFSSRVVQYSIRYKYVATLITNFAEFTQTCYSCANAVFTTPRRICIYRYSINIVYVTYICRILYVATYCTLDRYAECALHRLTSLWWYVINKGGGKPQSSGRECASRERPNPRVVILSYGASSCPLVTNSTFCNFTNCNTPVNESSLM